MPGSQKQSVVIDTAIIPSYVRPFLLAPFVDFAIELMNQPGMEEQYQVWLASKKTAEAAKSGDGGPQMRKEDER